MKAPAFEYIRPSSLAEVFTLLERYGDDARLLAGGQSLIPALNMRLASPAILIDISQLEGLSGITLRGGNVVIGALTRHRALEDSEDVARHLPLISQAIAHVAHPAVRNRGTLGGSIAFADPAAELPACSVALDAQFVLASRAGERRASARAFFKGLYETDLKPGEVLVRAEFPAQRPGYRSVFMELARRHGDYAIVGLAAHGAYRNNRFADVRFVFLGVGPKPMLAASVTSLLENRAFLPDVVAAVQSAVSSDIAPADDAFQSAATRLHLARVLAARALAKLATADKAP